jgi:uncharacterized protein (TIGR01777 family)
MRILVSGASGFVGGAVRDELSSRGDTVERLVRDDSGKGVRWDPASGTFDASAANGADAVVHLAGENVAAGRWSPERKRSIYDSRVVGTRLLAAGLATCSRRPKVIVAASAIGFYGDRGDAEQTESSPSGNGFLAEVSRDWEAALQPARDAGIRVVHLRFGLVLSPNGGALARMLPPFRLGLGGRMGDGRQWISWMTLHDLVRVIELAVDDSSLAGPVNAVSPTPVRNADFTEALAAAVARPALLPVPAFVLRFALGEMADETLLASTRAIPKILIDRGFRFDHPSLESALGDLLERS